jgi:predicted metal-dependent hydrolase
MSQLDLPFGSSPSDRRAGDPQTLVVAGVPLTVSFVRHRRARHYLLRVEADGSLRVTIPRGGSLAEATRFVREKAAWIQRERYRAALARDGGRWQDGTPVLLDGEPVPLRIAGAVAVLGPHRIPLAEGGGSVRAAVERHLRSLATRDLPARLMELAALAGFDVRSVSVRNQRSRWGSCSAAGRISLNWRLVQMPVPVRDYVLLHELAHLKHPNHSARFWQLVERLCPSYREARAWLRGWPID